MTSQILLGTKKVVENLFCKAQFKYDNENLNNLMNLDEHLYVQDPHSDSELENECLISVQGLSEYCDVDKIPVPN